MCHSKDRFIRMGNRGLQTEVREIEVRGTNTKDQERTIIEVKGNPR